MSICGPRGERTLRGRVAVALLVIATCSCLPGCRRDAAVAWLEQAQGTAEVARGEDWQPAPVGQKLHIGDAVRTGPASSARLRFASGRLLYLGENALVRLSAGGTPAQPRVNIELGEAVLEGEGEMYLATSRGLARLDPSTRMRVRATLQSTRYEVMVGRAVMLEEGSE